MRQSGFFHEQAGFHLESEQLLAMPPPRALTGHYVRGVWEPTDHPETPKEKSDRLRQVACHRLMWNDLQLAGRTPRRGVHAV